MDWFDLSPGKIVGVDEATSLETNNSFDVFLELFINHIGRDFVVSDYYNYYDLNRVETNVDTIADLIETFAVRPTLEAIITNRTKTSIEYYDSLNRIERNILALKNATYQPTGWITPKTNWVSVVDAFGYTDANRLESNLANLYQTISNIADAHLKCGTFNCGQGNTLF